MIAETELIAEMKNSREISANEGLLGLGFSTVKIKDLGEGRAQQEESYVEKLGHGLARLRRRNFGEVCTRGRGCDGSVRARVRRCYGSARARVRARRWCSLVWARGARARLR
jgi:hypothetical protein